MAHWTDYTTRGALAFLSFMHIGTAFRCFIDQDFLRTKIFTTTEAINVKHDSVFDHVFGIYSIMNALILIQSSIYLYVYPITRLVIGTLLAHLCLFILESVVYKTINLHGSTLYPVTFTGIALVWMITFHYIWKPWQNTSEFLEMEKEAYLKYGLPIKKSTSKRRFKDK